MLGFREKIFSSKLASFYTRAARNGTHIATRIGSTRNSWRLWSCSLRDRRLIGEKSRIELLSWLFSRRIILVITSSTNTNFCQLCSILIACTIRITYQIREGINFGTFKRNVVFFKSIALFHLGYNYFIKYFQYDLISLAMILGGYSLSFSAVRKRR